MTAAGALQQLTLNFQPGLAMRHSSLRSCAAQGIYQRGLEWVAGQIDRSPSHLSEALSAGDRRKFSADDLEAYIAKTGDTTPILYLIDKFMRDPGVQQAEAIAKLSEIADMLPALMQAVGAAPPPGRVRRRR